MGCGASAPTPPAAERTDFKDPMAAPPAPPPTTRPENEVIAETIDDVVAPPAKSAASGGIQLALPTAKGATIVHSNASGLSDGSPGSLVIGQSQGSSILKNVELGALHEALNKGGGGSINAARFSEVLAELLPPADRPSAETVSALFRVFDTDGSGDVDEAELVAGCSQLCGGDPTERMALAFKCFDKDGDGHLDKAEIAALLRKTIEPAVKDLHAALDFADPSDLQSINDEAGGSAAVSAVEEGKVRVELKTPVGVATLYAPADALASDALGTDGAALSLDAFLTALVDSAMASHDQDGNGTIEASEFAAFASSNSFLSLWFGHLTEVNTGKTTWRDADVA